MRTAFKYNINAEFLSLKAKCSSTIHQLLYIFIYIYLYVNHICNDNHIQECVTELAAFPPIGIFLLFGVLGRLEELEEWTLF